MRILLSVSFCVLTAFAVMALPVGAQTADPMTAPAPAPDIATPSMDAPTPAPTRTHTVKNKTHKTKHHPTHKKTKARHNVHKKTVSHAASHSDALRNAQMHLGHLGYYSGEPDGVMGSKTASALKSFQRDKHLKTSGTLTDETRLALIKADKAHATGTKTHTLGNVAPQKNFFAEHPDFYGHTDPQYADPLLLSRGDKSNATPSQVLPSRFGQVSVTELSGGGMKHYNVTLNGQPILQANNQSSVIGISQTYKLSGEDVIVFSTYNPGDAVCAYRHNLLALRANGQQMLPIEACTREYKAGVTYDSLIVTFPQANDKSSIGATWRYQDGSLQKL